ncbi:hypothetical protein BDK51DRAFT_31972, partial [Blyttiomyces helicus]
RTAHIVQFPDHPFLWPTPSATVSPPSELLPSFHECLPVPAPQYSPGELFTESSLPSPPPELLSFTWSGNPGWLPVSELHSFQEGLPIGTSGVSTQLAPYPDLMPPSPATGPLLDPSLLGRTQIATTPPSNELLPSARLEWTPVEGPRSYPTGASIEASRASSQLTAFSIPPNRPSKDLHPPESTDFQWTPVSGPHLPVLLQPTSNTDEAQPPICPDSLQPSPIPSGATDLTPAPGPQAQTPLYAKPSRKPRANGTVIHEEKATCNTCGEEKTILVLRGQESLLASEHHAFTCGRCDAAAGTSSRPSRKTMHLEGATCHSCGQEHVVLLLHGAESSLAGERRMKYTCGPCDAAAGIDSASLVERAAELLPVPDSPPSGKRKKGPVKRRSYMVCSACARCVGVGQMQIRTDQRRREEWAEPDFDVEVVCLPCWTKYKFCTWCGGGGGFRTGKWRPRELFHPGKRNCSLSHERIGAVTYYYESRHCPDEVSPTDHSAMFSIWVDGQLSTRGESKQMEACAEFRTYASIIARCETSQLELANFIASDPGPGIQRLLVLQWEARISKPKRRKGAGTPPSDPGPLTAPSPPSPGPRRISGFMGAQVNHTKGTIFLAHGYTNSTTRAAMSGLFRGLITAGTAAHRANYPTAPPLAHFCAALFPVEPDAPDYKQHSHPSNWGGCGFGPVAKYVASKPFEETLFDEPGIYPDAASSVAALNIKKTPASVCFATGWLNTSYLLLILSPKPTSHRPTQ